MSTVTPAVPSLPLAAESNPSAADLPEEEFEELISINCSPNSRPPPQELQTAPPAVQPLPEEEEEEEDPEEFGELIHSICSPNTHPSLSRELQTVSPAVPSPPPFIQSISELRDLSSSIAAFQQCYEDLHNHLDSIKSAILSKLPLESGTLDITPIAVSTVNITTITPPTVDITPAPASTVENTPLTKSTVDITPPPSAKDVTSVHEETIQDQNIPQSELEGLCRTMCSRGIRRYIGAHLSDLPKLREEVPNALKLAPNVPKFVLECLGKFFLQGTKAYTKNSHMIAPREASIFVLECFLLLMGMNGTDNGVLTIEKPVKEEAETAALGWKKRLVAEGGLAKCNQVDARGLLLLVACFGIPNSFKREDIRDLVVAGKAKEVVSLLKKSQLLMDKIPGTVEWMMKNKMKVDAVDLTYSFGLEERFDPQIILLSYLQESKEFLEKPKRGGSAAGLNEAKKKHLDALKSVRKCLQRHKIDPTKLLPGWQIGEMISTLEKEITDHSSKSDDRIPQKRKPSEPESSRKSKTKEVKRSRYTNQGPPHQSTANHANTRRNMLPNHAVNYSASTSVIYGGPGAGLLPESMISQGVGVGPYAGVVHGAVLVDSAGQVLSRPQHYAYDAALVEKYAAQPSVGLTSLYRGSTSSVGLPNSPSVGTGSRSFGSDLYQFADSVVERESYATGIHRGVSGVPKSLPGHHLSYSYHHQL